MDSDDLASYYRDWSDEKLNQHAAAIADVQETRRQLASIPGLVASLAAPSTAGGGDQGALIDVITNPPQEPQPEPLPGEETP